MILHITYRGISGSGNRVKGKWRYVAAIIILCVAIHTELRAQFIDNFNQQSIDTAWHGDRHAFTIDEGVLRLDTTETGTASLYRVVSYPDSFLLEGYFSLDFPPSNSNKFSLYFMTFSPELDSTSGYLMTVGESGTSDALEIYRLDKGEKILLWRGLDGSMSDNPQCQFSLRRYIGGDWEIYLSFKRHEIPELRGQFHDNTYQPDSRLFYQIRCDYTSTRSDKFSFDNLSVQEIIPDTIAPILEEYIVINGKEISLAYNEKIAEASVVKENFILEGLELARASYGMDSTEIKLFLTEELPIAEAQELLIKNISDNSGNIASDTSIYLHYYASRGPRPGELIFTEVFPDPDRNGALPPYEFIELYNNSDAYLELGEVSYSDASSSEKLGDYTLEPGAYLIICVSEGEKAYKEYGKVMGLESFPTLNNSGDALYLRYQGETIDELHYNDALFGGSAFRQNGYSLELQKIYDPCAADKLKWSHSIAEIKASPGKQNSIWQTEGTISPIEFEYFRMPVDQLLELVFNKTLHPDEKIIDVSITPNLGISDLLIEDNVLKIMLTEPMKEGEMYTVQLNNIQDCIGEVSTDFSIEIAGAARELNAGDIIVNEVLYNPPSRTEQYIELKNCSDKAINLSSLLFVSVDDSVKETFTIKEDRIFMPQDLLVMSPDPANISDVYDIPYPFRLMKVKDFQSLNRKSGILRIIYMQGNTMKMLDSMKYADDYHSSFLDKTKGVSLERIGCFTDGFNENIWVSAAQTVNYGTPTYENSQRRVLPEVKEEDLFNLVSSTFSPDGDAYEDKLIIRYTGENTAQRLRLEIYNLHGRLIKTLMNNTGISSNELILWDGTTDSGTIATSGFYLIYAVVYDERGHKSVWKTSCVLTYAD